MLVNNTIHLQKVNMEKEESEKEKVYISQDLLNKAKESSVGNSRGVIYGDQTLALDTQNIQTLKQEFKNDFFKYENVFIAKGEAKKYLEDIKEFVMDDLNVGKADKDNDGVLSISESIYAKDTYDEYSGELIKAVDYLPSSLINDLKKDTSVYMSINEIINENIKVDTDKSGDVSAEEVVSLFEKQESFSRPSTPAIDSLELGSLNQIDKKEVKDIGSKLDTALEELKRQLAEVEKRIQELTRKLLKASDEEKLILNNQLKGLSAQRSEIFGKIMQVIQEFSDALETGDFSSL